MKSNFFSFSSILKKFLIFNLIVFLVLGIFTYLYLDAIKPNLVKNRSNQHTKIINNTSGHINRLNIEFTKESATKFLLDARFLFQNLDRVQLYDLNSNLLADTDTLDLAQDVFIRNQNVKEIPIDKSDTSINTDENLKLLQTTTFNTKNYVQEYSGRKNIIKHGKLVLDSLQLECEWNGNSLPEKLTTTEFLIVKELAKRPGIIKERAQLMDIAYKDNNDIEDRTIDSHVKRIRKKFKKVDQNFSAIETRYGSGYRWNIS